MSALAALVRSPDPLAIHLRSMIFGSEFQQAGQWTRFIENHLGARPSVTTILDKVGDDWSVVEFQALFVACWIHFPLEKGSFMIEMNENQRQNVKKGYKKISWRPSSHLSGVGRSAAWNNRQFLKGYHELLVQLEKGGPNSPTQSCLFLKAEGECVQTFGHMKEWYEKDGIPYIKKGTGKGATHNAMLKVFGGRGTFGITDRAAENFNPSYNDLLKRLDLGSKTTTVQNAADAILDRIRTVLQGLASGGKALNFTFQQLITRAGFPAGLASPMYHMHVGHLSNDQLATFLREVIVPISAELGRSTPSSKQDQKFVRDLSAAQDDLLRLAVRLDDDAQQTGETHVPRVSEEVRVSQHVLDESLTTFLQSLG